MVEKICELDDDLMMAYLEGEEPSIDEMKAALRKGTCECTAVRFVAEALTVTKVFRKLLDAISGLHAGSDRYPVYQGYRSGR